MTNFKKLIILSATILVSLSLFFSFEILKKKDISQKRINIPKGSSASAIAQKLESKRIISNYYLFRIYLKLTNNENNLTAGQYSFNGKFNIIDLVNKLVEGEINLVKVTFPEGILASEYFNILKKKGLTDSLEIQNVLSDSSFINLITDSNSKTDLNGFLYPETYYFNEESNLRDIITHLKSELTKRSQKLNFSNSDNLSYYQVLTLASIIEGEAKHIDEMKKIASVYLNRIRINQKLQADPTVAYILKKRGISRKRILYKDLKIESPFNTYLNYGLPPAPINNPSISAIKAVLSPDKTDYYYFFADDNGYHIFSKTYRQHVNRLNKKRRNIQ